MPARSGRKLPVLGDLPAHEFENTAGRPTNPRLLRLRRVAWLLDRSISIGGERRIGIDPLIGLIPGIGDWIGAALSLYVLYEAARLGLPLTVLGRMAANIAIEALIGAVPIAGDLFDFVWQANIRNVKLVDQHYRPSLQPRTLQSIWLALGIFAVVLFSFMALAIYGVIKLVMALFA